MLFANEDVVKTGAVVVGGAVLGGGVAHCSNGTKKYDHFVNRHN